MRGQGGRARGSAFPPAQRKLIRPGELSTARRVLCGRGFAARPNVEPLSRSTAGIAMPRGPLRPRSEATLSQFPSACSRALSLTNIKAPVRADLSAHVHPKAGLTLRTSLINRPHPSAAILLLLARLISKTTPLPEQGREGRAPRRGVQCPERVEDRRPRVGRRAAQCEGARVSARRSRDTNEHRVR